MKHILIAGLVLIAFGVLGVVALSPRLSDGVHTDALVATSTPPHITLVSLKDAYRRGTHTISGAIITPTPCYTVTARADTVPSTTPTVIRLDLTVPNDTGRCLALSATTTFTTKHTAAKDATVKAYMNGVFATSTAQ